MTTPKLFRAMALITLVFIAGCSDNGTTPQATPTEDSNSSSTANDIPSSVKSALAILSRAYTASQNVWVGFDVLEHPSILVFRDSNKVSTSIIALNFPSLPLLGETLAIDVESAPFTAVQVTKPSSVLEQKISELRNFEFTADIDDVSTYMISITEGDEGVSPDNFDFGQYFIHEMFHRYQMQSFQVAQADQSLSDYPFTAANIALAILEERALKAALEADTIDQRNLASRHFAAIRIARRAAEPRVALDDSQETYEGTARYIEHKLAGDDTSVSNNNDSFRLRLTTNADSNFSSVKSHFGFSRFYASGAAIVEIIRKTGISDYQSTIENGTDVPSVLIAHLQIDSTNYNELVDNAWAAYDDEGKLNAVAETLAAKAATEPEDGSSGEGDDVPITPEQEACLEDLGVDLSDPANISQNALDTCIPR